MYYADLDDHALHVLRPEDPLRVARGLALAPRRRRLRRARKLLRQRPVHGVVAGDEKQAWAGYRRRKEAAVSQPGTLAGRSLLSILVPVTVP